MRTYFVGGAILGLLCASLSTLHAAETGAYASLRAKVEAGDFSVDFRALRFAFAATPAYHPNSESTHRARQQLQAALEAKKYAKAVEIGEAWLATEYVNPFAHLGIARAHESLGATAKARFHHQVVDKLLDSICRAGEGRSPDLPCPVLSLDEEYFYLARHQFEIGSQYEQACAGEIPCHVFEVREPNTEVLHDLHFDISRPLAFQRDHPAAADES